MLPEDKSRHTPLSDALDCLSSEDVAPGWKAEGAWPRIEAQLGKRQRIPFMMYPLAAAAALILFVMLWRPAEVKQPHGIGGTTASEQTVRSSGKPALKEPAPEKLQPGTAILRSTFAERKATARTSFKNPITLPQKTTVVEVPSPSLQDTAPLAASQLAKSAPYHRRPAVIYTLSEIMADVPEREAPPKRFSGIFHSRLSADAPAGTPPRRRSGRGGEGDAPAPLIIIN